MGDPAAPAYHLAQLNVARLVAPIDSAALADFVAGLAPVNALADAAPGFVWRLQEDSGDATGLRPWGDDMIVNLSVWTDLACLEAYVYGEAHAAVLKQRRMFFTRMETPALVLWWVPEGHEPSLDEARDRLDGLEADGPTQDAFTMRQPFPPPAETP